jgi:rifampicin phosphotransferase
MLTVPSFQEAPVPLLELLRAYATVEGESPEQVMARQDAERRAETERVLALLRRRRLIRALPGPSYALPTLLALRATQGAIVRRERARLKQALLYSRCRRIALAIGERLTAAGILDSADDVFFLTIGEADALASGTAMFPYHVAERVARRRAEHAELSALQPPDTFLLPRGEYLRRDGTPPALPPSCAQRDIAAAAAGAAAELVGNGACGGSVTARAMVLQDVTEAAVLEDGDILVTRQTDPGWGPVFFLVSGLVIERGGMLSHGAIIAREFGLPCVVGVPGATRRIPSGARVTVDGDSGRVLLHD